MEDSLQKSLPLFAKSSKLVKQEEDLPKKEDYYAKKEDLERKNRELMPYLNTPTRPNKDPIFLYHYLSSLAFSSLPYFFSPLFLFLVALGHVQGFILKKSFCEGEVVKMQFLMTNQEVFFAMVG